MENATFDQRPATKALKQYYDNELSKQHLKDLLGNEERNAELFVNREQGNFCLDFTHTKLDQSAYKLLGEVAQEAQIFPKIQAMFKGEKINNTEGRSVLHVALRKPKDASLIVDGVDVVKDVHEVLERIAEFSKKVREGTVAGFTGKRLKNIVAIGIGGSFLGPEFVFEALKHDATCKAASAAQGMQLKFLANVDPVDFFRATDGLDVEETLFVIVSKTFTTAETMLNARTCRQHILDYYAKAQPGCDTAKVLASHLCAVSTNLVATKDFGISDENVFGFWSWVGGRYSVSSAVGVLPLSLYYGFDNVQAFLNGMHDIDNNFSGETDYTKNIPALVGLLGFYNSHVAGHASRAILPYCQALLRFPAHIQQCDMESNGKTVTRDGVRYASGVDAGPIIFGEPGTNGQHSFYQLMHQGRVVPAEFIGYTKSQAPVMLAGEPVSNHEELMANFFAQPDALALGKDIEALKAQGVPEALQEHKLFGGDRPSFSLLFFGALDAFKCGQLLAIYEHRVAVEGFLFDCNSFDQWGVELGKALAKDTRGVFAALVDGSKTKADCIPKGKFNAATGNLLQTYIDKM